MLTKMFYFMFYTILALMLVMLGLLPSTHFAQKFVYEGF